MNPRRGAGMPVVPVMGLILFATILLSTSISLIQRCLHQQAVVAAMEGFWSHF